MRWAAALILCNRSCRKLFSKCSGTSEADAICLSLTFVNPCGVFSNRPRRTDELPVFTVNIVIIKFFEKYAINLLVQAALQPGFNLQHLFQVSPFAKGGNKDLLIINNNNSFRCPALQTGSSLMIITYPLHNIL